MGQIRFCVLRDRSCHRGNVKSNETQASDAKDYRTLPKAASPDCCLESSVPGLIRDGPEMKLGAASLTL